MAHSDSTPGSWLRKDIAEELDILHRLYPDFSEPELVQTKEDLDEYADMMWRIYLRVKSERPLTFDRE
jgi:hypothetical protein